VLFAVASGLAVANAYSFQPLLEAIGTDVGLSHATVGLVGTVAQVGYGLGLVCLVPLGDRVDARRLIVGQLALSVLALAAVAAAPTAAILLAGMATVGVLAVVTQLLVAHAAALAHPADRGRVVGTVTSGIVLGILLARTVSGAIADLAGWRSVYVVSAAATFAMAAILAKALPRREAPRGEPIAYPRLIWSAVRLFAEVPVLRVRATLATLIFAAFVILMTPMALPLSAPPYELSTTQVGLFGLAGVIGALGASRAGRWADRGLAQRTTGIGLAVMLASWLPIALLPQSLWGLVIGVVAIDYGLQSVHVSNQSLIYRVRPEAQSRLTAAYMLCYSLGSASGAIASTVVYARAGWTGVCVLGALLSLAALVFWTSTKEKP
jgi:predicted MFS family arabinose efflux permease